MQLDISWSQARSLGKPPGDRALARSGKPGGKSMAHLLDTARGRGAGAGASGTMGIAQIDRFLGPIYDGPLETPPWNTVLSLLRENLRAAHVTLILRPPSWDSSGVIVNTDSASDQATESYKAHFFAIDPFVRLPDDQIVTPEELIGDRWLKSPLYREYLRPLDIRHIIGADIYTPEGIECRFRVTRSHNAPPFSEQDKALCRFLLPHFKRAIQLHSRLDYLESEREFFAGTVNRLQMGMINLSASGSVLASNAEARRILLERDGIWLSGNTLCVDSKQESRELQQLIREAAHGQAGIDGPPAVVDAMSLTRPSGRAKLGVVAKTIATGPWSESRQRPAAVLFLRDPEASATQPSQDVMRQLFGFSRMESALAVHLADGLTLDEAAAQLKIRRNTARTYLRYIFCKTGVTRQTLLVRMLLNSVVRLG